MQTDRLDELVDVFRAVVPERADLFVAHAKHGPEGHLGLTDSPAGLTCDCGQLLLEHGALSPDDLMLMMALLIGLMASKVKDVDDGNG